MSLFVFVCAAAYIAIAWNSGKAPAPDAQEQPTPKASHPQASHRGVERAPSKRINPIPCPKPLPSPKQTQRPPACPTCGFCGQKDHALKVGDEIPIHEDRFHEFKASQMETDDDLEQHFKRYACAFLNRGGGMLWLGVSDDGKICGIPCDSERVERLRSRFESIASRFDPVIGPEMYQVKHIALATEGNPTSKSLVCIIFSPSPSSRIVYHLNGSQSADCRALASVRKLSAAHIMDRQRHGLPGSKGFKPSVCPISTSVVSQGLVVDEVLPRRLKGKSCEMKVAFNPLSLLNLFEDCVNNWKNGPKVLIWFGIDSQLRMSGLDENRELIDGLMLALDDIAYQHAIDPAFYEVEMFKLSTGNKNVSSGKILLRLALLPKPYYIRCPSQAPKSTSVPESPPSVSVKHGSRRIEVKAANTIPMSPSDLATKKSKSKTTSVPKKGDRPLKKPAQQQKTRKAPVTKAKIASSA